MRMKTLLFLLICACFGSLTSVQAQGQGSQQGGAVAPSATSSSSSFGDQGIRNYLLGPGDVLEVRVWGQPDLSGTAEVESDGNITAFHFIDKPIRAQCRTEKEVAKDVTAAYRKYIKDPQVSVRVTERKSHPPATVFGAVYAPARLEMKRRVRLNELIASVGGITERANGNIQILHTERVMCPEPGEVVEPDTASDGYLKIPFQVYRISDLLAGKEEANPYIRPGDIVRVMEAEPVYITGSVVSPNPLYLREGLTLGRALAMVGGVKKEGKANSVHIIRQKPGSSEQEVVTVDYAAIKKGHSKDVPLKAYDVIEVPEASRVSPQRLGDTVANMLTGTVSTLGQILPYRIIY